MVRARHTDFKSVVPVCKTERRKSAEVFPSNHGWHPFTEVPDSPSPLWMFPAIPISSRTAPADCLETIKEKVRGVVAAKGVIHYSLQFCQPYIMESIPVEKALEAKNIPTLRIETDYSMEDAGQLKTRVEAFIEQLK
jgi:hypothetical protein